MVRRFGIAVVLLLCSGVLLSGCRWEKTKTVQNSDVSAVQHQPKKWTLQELTQEDLMPSGSKWTRHLSLAGQAITVQDDGLREVFVESGTTDIPKAILQWITIPYKSESQEKLSIKQATIGIWWHTVTLPWGSGLKEHLIAYNATMSVSWEDLIIKGIFTQPWESYLLVKNTLPENYLVTNPQDRFGDAIYMLPNNEYSLLKMNWSSDVQGITLQYSTGDRAVDLTYGYSNTDAIFSTLNEDVMVPGNTSLTLVPVVPSASATLYQVTFTSTPGEKQWVERLGNDEIASHLVMYAHLHWYGIVVGESAPKNSSGAWEITTTDAKEQALFLVEPTYSYLVPLHNYPFTVDLQKDASDDYRPYYSRLLTTYRLDNESVHEALTKLFGKKSYRYEPRDNWFTYEPEPKRAYTGTLEIRSLFGQKATVPVNYLIDTIDPRAVVQEIVANQTISILPREGSFQDILVQYKNIGLFKVYFQPCILTSAPDVLSTYKGVGIENYLFDCKGEPVAQEVKPVERSFEYRKAYRTAVPVPTELATADAFKVSFKNQRGEEQTHYMLKSDVWIRTKIADNQLMVWWFAFDTGKPLEAGSIKVTNLEGKNLGTASLREGSATINLPDTEDVYDYATQRKKETLFVELTSWNERAFVIAHKSGRGDVAVPASGPQWNERYLRLNSKLDANEVVTSNQQINQRGTVEPVKIYGYTDRGLYKAGETISFAGWVRDVLRFDALDYLKDETVGVTLSSPLWWEPVVITWLSLDAYGGFVWSYTLPKTLPLGEYFIEYRLNDRVAYTHNIKVEEYQKPTFFVDITHATKNNMVHLVMKPSYFFGTPMSSYDIKVTWSLVGKDICRYCRWWNDDPFYFNHVFQDTITTWGAFTLYNQTATELTHALYPSTAMQNKGYQYTLKVDAIVKDRLSDETQYITKHIDFQPEVMLWLSGQPYERLYRDTQKTDPRIAWKIEGKIDKGASLVKQTRYEVYRWSYDQEFQKGVDGNLYIVNGQSYLPVASGTVTAWSTFTLPHTRLQKPWEYFVRVIAEDANGAVVGEVQKKIGRYQSSESESDLLGAVPNTYTLAVDIPKKTYQEWENIPLNIVPYQRDARVVITVERGQYVIDSFVKQLDGNQLTIPVKKWYAPNVVVSVMMLQGTQMNISPRKEPRFFAGYAEAQIDTQMHQLNIAVRSDKSTYEPGDLVTLTLTTTDAAGRPVDARVSVAVVDQALTTLYTLLKEPLPYFFNKVGTSVFTYTNMKLLYQSLKAFATWWSKWWAGQWWKAMFGYIRDNLPDAAFWSGAVYTTNGKATVSFVAPDNVTTWLVDVIGISKDTKLWTTTTWFVVKKDLIIEPNAPLFVTLGDSLTIPVKVVAPGVWGWGKVSGSAWMANEQGDRIELWTFSVEPNKTIAVPLQIPYERWTSRRIEFGVEGSWGSAKDGQVQRIPLRSEGFISKDTVGTINTAGSHTFTIPESLTQNVSVHLAQLPTNFLDPIITYLVHYPYGCTEQLLSSLLPLVTVQKLSEQHIFSSPLLSGGIIATSQWPIPLDDALRDGITLLLTHQRADGWFGYRAESQESWVSESIYVLSAYVYDALHYLRDYQYIQPQIQWALSRLDGFLTANKSISKAWWYQYLLSKATHGNELSEAEKASLNDIAPNATNYLPLLRYLIAVATKDTEAMKTRKPLAHIPTNSDEWTATSVFWNTATATAMKLRAYIADPTTTQIERSELLLSLLKQRDTQWLWWRSTQTNLQVMLTLSELATFWQPKKEITCSVQVNDEKKTLKVTQEMQSATFPVTLTGIQVDWSCDSALLADVVVSFLPKDLAKTLWKAQHVSHMERSISDPSAKIGQQVDIVGSFSTDLAGEQVAVDMFVPSDYKLLEVISSKMPEQNSPDGYAPVSLPFILSDPHCFPTHRETRFDRLFLYYDKLEPGTCDITISAVKAYSWTTTVMPMRVAEMYKGLVNGRKVIIK